MAYPVSTTYPSQDNLRIRIGSSPVDAQHWKEGIAEKQHFSWAHRRTQIINLDFSKLTSYTGWGTGAGIVANTVTQGTAFYDTPVTSALFTPPDHDANVEWVFRPRFRVTGGPGNGIVRIGVDDGGGLAYLDFTVVAGTGWQWYQDRITMAAHVANARLALFAYVSAATATVEWSHLHGFVDSQPIPAGIGV